MIDVEDFIFRGILWAALKVALFYYFCRGGAWYMAWKEIQHTADVGFEVETQSLNDLFIEAAFALYGVCYGDISVLRGIRHGSHETIMIDGIDLEELMVSWLNELIYIWESKNVLFIPLHVNVKRGSWHLEADGLFAVYRQIQLPIKAATYGGLVIRGEPRPFLRIFLDV